MWYVVDHNIMVSLYYMVPPGPGCDPGAGDPCHLAGNVWQMIYYTCRHHGNYNVTSQPSSLYNHSNYDGHFCRKGDTTNLHSRRHGHEIKILVTMLLLEVGCVIIVTFYHVEMQTSAGVSWGTPLNMVYLYVLNLFRSIRDEVRVVALLYKLCLLGEVMLHYLRKTLSNVGRRHERFIHSFIKSIPYLLPV